MGTFRFEKAQSPGGGARARTVVTFLDDLVVASFRGEAHTINRSADLIAANPTAVLKVRIYKRGECLLVQGDAQTLVKPDAIHFIDHNRPHRQIGTEMEHVTLGVPYHAVSYDPALHPAHFSIPLDTPRGRLLHSALASVFDEVRTLDQADAAGVAMAIKGLVRGVIAGGIGFEASDHHRVARVAAMKAFIDQNLAEPELGIDMLLEKFGASRATVYRDFAEDGGLQNFILSRRLHRAYRALSEARRRAAPFSPSPKAAGSRRLPISAEASASITASGRAMSSASGRPRRRMPSRSIRRARSPVPSRR
jgi:AraC-like DNA-binding protein